MSEEDWTTANFCLSEEDLRGAEASDRYLKAIRDLKTDLGAQREQIDKLVETVEEMKNGFKEMKRKLKDSKKVTMDGFEDLKKIFSEKFENQNQRNMSTSALTMTEASTTSVEPRILILDPEDNQEVEDIIVASTENRRESNNTSAPLEIVTVSDDEEDEEKKKSSRKSSVSSESSGFRRPSTSSKSKARKRRAEKEEEENKVLKSDDELFVFGPGQYIIAVLQKSGQYLCNTCPKTENTREEIREHHESVHVGEYKMSTDRENRGKRMSTNLKYCE